MTDVRLQELRRLVAAGDPSAGPALLVARMRAGELSQERVDLAAYCGHEAALRVTGAVVSWPASSDTLAVRNEEAFGRWVQGLSRWGSEVQVRAAVAAAKVALEADKRDGGCLICECACHRENTTDLCEVCGFMDDIQAIVAAERWLASPDEASELIWRITYREHLPLWIPVWTFIRGRTARQGPESRCPEEAISSAARLAGEAPVRDAVRSALVEWALGGSP